MRLPPLVFLFIALLVVAYIFGRFGRSRSQDILRYWASRNGYHLIEQKYVRFFKGPFFWTSAKGQSVYRVVVEDGAGFRRSGWVRCGSWGWGILSNETQVYWDDQ